MEIIPSLSRVPLALSNFTSGCCIRAAAQEETKVHQYWTYPLNGIVSLIGIALQPLCILINLLVAGIFKLIAYFTESKKLDLEAKVNLLVGLKSLHAMFTLFVRIFYPAFSLNINTYSEDIRIEEGKQQEIQHLREAIPQFLKERAAEVESYRKGEAQFDVTFRKLSHDLNDNFKQEIGSERYNYLDIMRIPGGMSSGGAQIIVEEELFKAIVIDPPLPLSEGLKTQIEQKLADAKKEIAANESQSRYQDYHFKQNLSEISIDVIQQRQSFSLWPVWWHVRNLAYSG